LKVVQTMGAGQLAELTTYETNRLLAVYYSESDLGRILKNEEAELNKYMLVQTMESTVKKSFTKSQFQDFIEKGRNDQNKLWDQYKDKIVPWMEKSSENIANAQNFINFDMKIGQVVPLGIFYDVPEAFSFAQLVKITTSMDGVTNDSVLICGSSFILVNNKILFVYVYSNFNNQDDIDWVRNISKTWIKSIEISN